MDSPEPVIYEQPVQDFPGREVHGSLEHVDYISQSHMRIWYNTQNDLYPWHHHNSLEIILCMDQDYSVRTNDQTWHLQPGDIFFIAPHVLHEIPPSNGGSRFIFLLDLDPFLTMQDFQVFILALSPAYLCSSSVHADLYPSIHEGLMEIVQNYFSNEPLWEASIYSRLLEFLVQISRQYLEAQSATADTGGKQYRDDYGKLRNLIGYLNDHYSERISQEQAADIAGFSKFYFSRLFKQVTGHTFQDYLAQKRITEAQSLLSSDCPITEIAFRTGFSNLSSFNRCFKKYTHCSPSDYRHCFRREHT